MESTKSALEEALIRELIDRAQKMRELSYCPYSGFSVGAALLTGQGKIYGGCNIENAAYSVTICAERAAMAKAVSEGDRDFRAIAVVGGRSVQPEDYSFPCGTCRQFMREFAAEDAFEIIVAKSREDYKIFTLRQLLPESFGPGNLV